MGLRGEFGRSRRRAPGAAPASQRREHRDADGRGRPPEAPRDALEDARRARRGAPVEGQRRAAQFGAVVAAPRAVRDDADEARAQRDAERSATRSVEPFALAPARRLKRRRVSTRVVVAHLLERRDEVRNPERGRARVGKVTPAIPLRAGGTARCRRRPRRPSRDRLELGRGRRRVARRLERRRLERRRPRAERRVVRDAAPRRQGEREGKARARDVGRVGEERAELERGGSGRSGVCVYPLGPARVFGASVLAPLDVSEDSPPDDHRERHGRARVLRIRPARRLGVRERVRPVVGGRPRVSRHPRGAEDGLERDGVGARGEAGVDDARDEGGERG